MLEDVFASNEEGRSAVSEGSPGMISHSTQADGETFSVYRDKLLSHPATPSQSHRCSNSAHPVLPNPNHAASVGPGFTSVENNDHSPQLNCPSRPNARRFYSQKELSDMLLEDLADLSMSGQDAGGEYAGGEHGYQGKLWVDDSRVVEGMENLSLDFDACQHSTPVSSLSLWRGLEPGLNADGTPPSRRDSDLRSSPYQTYATPPSQRTSGRRSTKIARHLRTPERPKADIPLRLFGPDGPSRGSATRVHELGVSLYDMAMSDHKGHEELEPIVKRAKQNRTRLRSTPAIDTTPPSADVDMDAESQTRQRSDLLQKQLKDITNRLFSSSREALDTRPGSSSLCPSSSIESIPRGLPAPAPRRALVSYSDLDPPPISSHLRTRPAASSSKRRREASPEMNHAHIYDADDAREDIRAERMQIAWNSVPDDTWERFMRGNDHYSPNGSEDEYQDRFLIRSCTSVVHAVSPFAVEMRERRTRRIRRYEQRGTNSRVSLKRARPTIISKARPTSRSILTSKEEGEIADEEYEADVDREPRMRAYEEGAEDEDEEHDGEEEEYEAEVIIRVKRQRRR